MRPLRLGLLFLAAAALTAVTALWGINPHDEGLALQQAARVMDGDLPYRDFYCNYGPGQPYLLGLLDSALGPSLLTWRIVRVLLDATVALLAYVLARRHASEPLALGAWLAVAAAMAFPTIPSPNPAAIALGLGSILLARRSAVGAGLLAGLSMAFRIDVGLAAALGACLAAAAEGGRWRALVAAGTSAVVGAVLMAPFVIASPSDWWEQTLGFGLGKQDLQRLPLPGAWDGGFEPNKILWFYFPYVLIGGLALWAAAALAERAPLRDWAPLPLALAGLGYLLARADEFHYIPLAVVLPVLLAVAAERSWRRGHRWPAAALAAVIALIALYGLDRKRVQLFESPRLAAIDVDVADGVRAPVAEARAIEELVPYVRERVPPGEPVFVANPRHDLVKVGNPLVYVLVQRPNPTRYDVFQPGVITEAPAQREVVSALERTRTRLVIRWLDPVASAPEPNGAGVPSGVHILDRYLERNYRPERRFGDYEVLRRAS
ncbi:MAG: hypothetical protein JW895_16130 [Thermoleophilaceae bacterium]|nr:hypothetical protein [Thermoleophilaceae bacterium]